MCGRTDKNGGVDDAGTLYVGEADFEFKDQKYKVRNLEFPDICTSDENTPDELFGGRATIHDVHYQIEDN